MSEKTTYEDLEYVMSFAQERLKYNIKNIILWGFSLGTGPTVELASRLNIFYFFL
jgi:abhydrolase domain-containing protein 17